MVAGDDLPVLVLDLGQHRPGLDQFAVARRSRARLRRGSAPLEVRRVEEHQLRRAETDRCSQSIGPRRVGQRLGQVLAAVQVGDGGAAPGVPDEVDPAARPVDEDEAHAEAGGAPAERGHGPLGEAPARSASRPPSTVRVRWKGMVTACPPSR